ncbi:MAG: hypothetical protein NWF03_01935 [Candidatus Bathyarchaeota archaeon]|nr:hypothetical protein [Candidatus Bathyarchaeota archaeon]
MKITRNTKGISKPIFILLLILAMIIGGIFSYLLAAGYYLSLGTAVPESTSLSIKGVAFDATKPGTFEVTVLNPTYSPTTANIAEIFVITEDNNVYTIDEVDPELPTTLAKGKQETFTCTWDWGDFGNEYVKVVVTVEDGSGSVYNAEVAPVQLTIAPVFATVDTEHFNITVTNQEESSLDLEITKITVTLDDQTEIEITETTPSLPRDLAIDNRQAFKCAWTWTNYREREITITVYTAEGFTFTRNYTTPDAVQLAITDVDFDVTDMEKFEVTIQNTERSTASADITTVSAMLANQTMIDIPIDSPATPYTLGIGDSVTLTCILDWEDLRGSAIAIAVETPEGYYGYMEQTIP